MRRHAVKFHGGISIEQGVLDGNAGALTHAINYEALPTGGYRTTRGYHHRFQFPNFPGAGDKNVQQLGYHPALARGYVVVGVDGTGPCMQYTLWNDPPGEELVYRLDLGVTNPVFTHHWSGVFVHSGEAKHWLFFAGRGGRVTAVTAAAPQGNPFLTQNTDVSTFATLRAADASNDPQPSYGIVHANHCWVTSGRSLFCSTLGNPVDWTTALNGAAEFRMDADIVGLTATAGGVLLIYTSAGVHGIYGTDVDTFEMKKVVSDVRVLPGSVQDLSIPIFAAEGAGLMSLQTAQEFGDFSSASLSTDIRDIMRWMGSDIYGGNTIIASYVDPGESQYHLLYRQFNSQQKHLCVPIFGGQALGATFIEWPDDIRLFTRLRQSGDEGVAYFPLYGATLTGHVFEIGGIDGGAFARPAGVTVPIHSFLSTRFTHCGSPGLRKRFRRLHLEINSFPWQGQGLARSVPVVGLPSYDFDDPDLPRAPTLATVGSAEPGYWDVDAWDTFYWSGQSYQFATLSLQGTGETFALTLSSQRQYDHGHVVMGYVVEYDERRRIRG